MLLLTQLKQQILLLIVTYHQSFLKWPLQLASLQYEVLNYVLTMNQFENNLLVVLK
ncbi:Uncharacterised protein [Streptococcus pneumoniae]|nr:Uncharacterised protein [Streptococcus pneumoniae]CKH09162.1 Uncharacterised protein [Streptococcus pneumoniae]